MKLGAFGEALDRFAAGRPLLAGADASCRFEGSDGGCLGIMLLAGRPLAEPVERDVASFTFAAPVEELAVYLCGRTPLAPFVWSGQVTGDLVALSAVTGTFETGLWHSLAASVDPAELAELLRAPQQ